MSSKRKLQKVGTSESQVDSASSVEALGKFSIIYLRVNIAEYILKYMINIQYNLRVLLKVTIYCTNFSNGHLPFGTCTREYRNHMKDHYRENFAFVNAIAKLLIIIY